MPHDGFPSAVSAKPHDIRRIPERGGTGLLPHRARPSRRKGDLRVLVVEDEAVIGILIEDILLDIGCGCIDLVSSVDSSLALLEEVSPDFAFLDINLNGTRSYPVADVLKSRDIPFVFLSAYCTHGLDTVHANEKILQKPFRSRDLELAVERAFPALRPVGRAA